MIALIGLQLRNLTLTLSFIFLVYSLYFTGDYEFSILKGIVAFILIVLFVWVSNSIPFGASLSPILFEWWWHDIPFWEFSTLAISISIANLVALSIFFGGIFLESRR